MVDALLIIIVIYNKKLSESQSYKTLKISSNNCEIDVKFFIYDNSPIYDKELKQLDSETIHYISDPSNPGLSRAFNAGAEFALKNGIQWLMLADDDTLFAENFLPEFAEKLKYHTEINLFSPILKLDNGIYFSPVRYKHKRGYPLKSIKEGLFSLKKYMPVNSGMIIRTDSFFLAGSYNPKLKVDFCDFQFLEKFKTQNDYFYVLNSTGIQTFSNQETSFIKQFKRFEIFLEDARNADKSGIKDSMGFLYTVGRHTIGLSIKFQRFDFLLLFFERYLLKK